jgi:hypothetical protein
MTLKLCKVLFLFSCLGCLSLPLSALAQGFRGDTVGAKRSGIYPLPVFFYTPETGFAGGVAAIYLHRDTASAYNRPSDITGDVIYTEKKQVILEFNGDFYFADGDYRLLTDVSYKNYPNSFFGIGNDVSTSARESYTSETAFGKFVLYRKIYSDISVAPTIQYESSAIVQTKQGGLLESGGIPGSGGGRVVGAGIVANWDSRDKTFAAYSGSFYQVTGIVNGRALGSDFAYSDLEVDLRNFYQTFQSQVLALQVTSQILSGTPPFQDLARFGGQDFLRGYFDGQYRDKTEIGGQFEYRIPVWWRFGVVAFAGVAQVADKVSQWSLDEFKFAGGGGIRFVLNREERVSIRLDMGYGSHSSGTYLTVTEAF